jgi:hypothetical protein
MHANVILFLRYNVLSSSIVIVVGKPSGVPEDIVYLQDSDDDDEKETNLEHKESDKLGIECIIEGQAGAKIATLGSKVCVILNFHESF